MTVNLTNTFKTSDPSKLKLAKLKKHTKKNRKEKRFLSPKPIMPKKLKTLFVIKPLKNYEPYNIKTVGKKFIADPNVCFKEFPPLPRDHEEAKFINERLSGEKLMRIQVDPVNLYFGKIFVKSSKSLYFQIKNELRVSIGV